jgi:hypothetical protein
MLCSSRVKSPYVVKLCQVLLICCGVQDENEDSNLDFSAESLGDYIFDELQLLGYDFNAIIELICGDNTSCNPKLARLIGDHINQPVPLIGCASLKLNLAVLHHVESCNWQEAH